MILCICQTVKISWRWMLQSKWELFAFHYLSIRNQCGALSGIRWLDDDEADVCHRQSLSVARLMRHEAFVWSLEPVRRWFHGPRPTLTVILPPSTVAWSPRSCQTVGDSGRAACPCGSPSESPAARLRFLQYWWVDSVLSGCSWTKHWRNTNMWNLKA